MDSQIPSTSNHKGRTNTASIGKRKVRTVDKIKEMTPFDKAVKKEDAKIFTPTIKKQREYKRKPRTVKESNSSSPCVKMLDNGLANTTAINAIAIPNKEVIAILFLKTLFNSSLFSAP